MWMPSWVELNTLPHILSTVRGKSSGETTVLKRKCCVIWLNCAASFSSFVIPWVESKLFRTRGWHAKISDITLKLKYVYLFSSVERDTRNRWGYRVETMNYKLSMVACEDIYCVCSLDLWLRWWVLFVFFQIQCVLCQHPHLSNVWFLIQVVGFEVKKTTPAYAVAMLKWRHHYI